MSEEKHFDKVKRSVDSIKKIVDDGDHPHLPVEVRGGTTVYAIGGNAPEQIAACLPSDGASAEKSAAFLAHSANAVEFLLAQSEAMQNVFLQLQESFKLSHEKMQGAFDDIASSVGDAKILEKMDDAWNAFEEIGVYLGVIEDEEEEPGHEEIDSEEDVEGSDQDPEDDEEGE